ncbi:MAG: DUF3108 domain-containing protein [Flavobacteriales bacterium]|nr:DUF3108 domain-containing protein [Flavobacteriales bacterium]
MKRLFLFCFSVLFLATGMTQSYEPEKVLIDTLENKPLRSMDNPAWQAGEKLTYRIHYGFVDAGEAVIEVKNSPYTFNGRDAYHIVGTGRSLGAFNWVFKVRDRYETYVDKEGLFPYRFIRDINEGNFSKKQDYHFDPAKRAVKTHRDKQFATPEFVHDMLSSFYFARCLDYKDAKPGDIFTIDVFMDNEIYPLKIKYQKTENVEMRQGTFRCMKFVPVVQEGRIFKTEEDLNVWITDDENKIPILVKSKILVGSIKMEVVEYKGLKNPIAKIN